MIEGNAFENVMVIPNDYILNQELKNYVYLLEGDKIKKQEVEIYPVINDNLICSGLKNGDLITNNFTLKDGTRVKIKAVVQP